MLLFVFLCSCAKENGLLVLDYDFEGFRPSTRIPRSSRQTCNADRRLYPSSQTRRKLDHGKLWPDEARDFSTARLNNANRVSAHLKFGKIRRLSQRRCLMIPVPLSSSERLVVLLRIQLYSYVLDWECAKAETLTERACTQCISCQVPKHQATPAAETDCDG